MAAVATFVGGYHRPPADDAPGMIWDLGANVGLTVADLGYRYPAARIVALEPDPGNVAQARQNTSHLGDRCEIISAAIWPTDGEVRLIDRGSEVGFRVGPGDGQPVRALSANSLLEITGCPDYVKMDIEGSEVHVLGQNTAWLRSVKVISVECHPPYSIARCRRDLEALGFDVEALPQSRRHRAHDCVVGRRRAVFAPADRGRDTGTR